MLFSAETSAHRPIGIGQWESAAAGNCSVKMQDKLLPKVDNHCHLGTVINQKLTWEDHTNDVYVATAKKSRIAEQVKHVSG